jgi:hypothetical protein
LYGILISIGFEVFLRLPAASAENKPTGRKRVQLSPLFFFSSVFFSPPPRDRLDRQTWPGYWIYHNRDDSISFGTEERDSFGWLPAEITRAVPESLINTIASMVCHAHRMGRKEAYDYLKQFVLEQMRVPAWPHYPMNDLGKMTPPPLPPALDE